MGYFKESTHFFCSNIFMSPMPPKLPSEKPGLAPWCWVIGFGSLVPFAGVLFALVSLVVGLIKIHQGGWKLFILAFLGFGVTGGGTYYIYYQAFLSQDNAVAQGLQKATEDHLTGLVQGIEAYKEKNGKYPAVLSDLPKVPGQSRPLYDVITMRGSWKNAGFFIYDVQPDGQTYYLFSRGLDGEGFTADDIFPRLDPASNTGYRQRPLDFASLQSSPVPASPAASSGPGQGSNTLVWRTPAEGLSESQQTQKPILYDITAEWCGPCRRLTSEVFENAECASRINRSFIPVRVMDRRREEGKNPDDIDALESKYELTGFPTLVVQFPGKSDHQKLVGFYGKDGTMDFLNKAVP